MWTWICGILAAVHASLALAPYGAFSGLVRDGVLVVLIKPLLAASAGSWFACTVHSLAANSKPRPGAAVVGGLLAMSGLSLSVAALAACTIVPPSFLGYTGLALALVVPGGALSVTAGILSFRTRRKRGHCRVCDYDLIGNVSGRCPECGTPIAAGTEAAAPPGPAEVKKPE